MARFGPIALVCLVAVASGPTDGWAQFTSGNLAVIRIGDGSTSLGPSAARVSVVEFTTGGSQVGSALDLPFSTTPSTFNQGNFSLGGAIATPPEGGLRLSADGHYLTVIGYDAAVGTTGGSAVGGIGSSTLISNSGSSIINRVIARIDASKSAAGIDTTTRLSDAFNQNSPRSVVSLDGTQFWAGGNSSGTSGGVRYVSSLGATTSTSIVSTEVRQATIASNRLFAATATTINVLGNNESPPTTASTLSSLGVSPTNTGSFVLLDRDPNVGATGLNGLDTLYVANNNATNALLKYEWDPTAIAWEPRGTANNNVANTGLFGLTAQIGANGVNLFATDILASNNRLLAFVDTSNFGENVNGSFTLLAQAGTNNVFRGVDFTPTPEPSALLLIGAVGLGLVRLVRRRRIAG